MYIMVTTFLLVLLAYILNRLVSTLGSHHTFVLLWNFFVLNMGKEWKERKMIGKKENDRKEKRNKEKRKKE